METNEAVIVVQETASPLIDHMIELSNRMEALAMEVVPVAWELSLTLARISAAQVLATGIMLLLLSGVMFYICRWCYLRALLTKSVGGDSDGWYSLVALIAAPSMGTSIAGAVWLFDLYAWVGIFYPEIYLAASIFKLT